MAARSSRSVDGLSTPVVDLRFPFVQLIWPIIFTTVITAVMSFVLFRGLFSESGSADRLPDSLLVFALFVGCPAALVVGYGRSSARSDGLDLLVRSGFVTRRIPVEDIEESSSSTRRVPSSGAGRSPNQRSHCAQDLRPTWPSTAQGPPPWPGGRSGL